MEESPRPIEQIESLRNSNLKRAVLSEWNGVWKFVSSRRKLRGDSERPINKDKTCRPKLIKQPTEWAVNESDPAISKAISMTAGMDNPVVFSTLKHALALEKMGSMEGAARLYAMALESSPNNVEILSNYGRALKHLRDFKAARQCYEHVLKVRCFPTEIWFLLCRQ